VLVTPENIRTLQRKLYRKAKQDPAFRFYALYDKVCRADILSHAYRLVRANKGSAGADDVAHALHRGHTQVIDADLSKYFDTIPHSNLMATVAERISDGAVLRLIRMWLKTPVIEEDGDGMKRRISGGTSNRKGTPQGAVISPLLANIYLHLLDRIWERHQLDKRLGAHLVRYADDLVVLCKQSTERPMEIMHRILARLGLTLNESKTRVVDAAQECFAFLGFEFRIAKSWRTGSHYPHVQPSRESLKPIKFRLTNMTCRNLTLLPLEEVVGNVNATLRGLDGVFPLPQLQ